MFDPRSTPTKRPGTPDGARTLLASTPVGRARPHPLGFIHAGLDTVQFIVFVSLLGYGYESEAPACLRAGKSARSKAIKTG